MLAIKGDVSKEQFDALKNKIAVLPEAVKTVSGLCAMDFGFKKVIGDLKKSEEYFQEKEFPLISLMIIIDGLFEAFGELNAHKILKYRDEITELLASFDATQKR